MTSFVVALKTQKNFAALGHRVRGIVEQIEKDPAQAAGIQPEPDRRRFILQFDAHGFDLGIRVQFRQQFVDELAVIGGASAVRVAAPWVNSRMSPIISLMCWTWLRM